MGAGRGERGGGIGCSEHPGRRLERSVVARSPGGSKCPWLREWTQEGITSVLLPTLEDPPDREALRFPQSSLTYEELHGAVAHLARRVRGAERIAVWASPSMETCVGVIATLVAGGAAVPINPKTGARELDYIINDCVPDMVVACGDVELPPAFDTIERVPVELDADASGLPPQPSPESPAFILYTSGTTGPPKGVVLPHRAVTSNLDALVDVWEWTADDVLVHGLPLFHVHGLILGIIGPLRRGASLRHVGSFSPEAVCSELATGATMLFGVPTMYHRLANAVESDRELADALGGARVLVSGSAALPVRDHKRIERATGQRIVERYGLTETLMNCAIRVSGDRRPGYVGAPLPGVELRLIDDDGRTVETSDDETIGEIVVRGPNLFSAYLNQPTAAAMCEGWFFTGDLATRAPDGYIRIVGRKATDLIKTGGYKVGAGEVEAALLEHNAVAEAAIVGAPDEDLGERLLAYVVLRGGTNVSEQELTDWVTGLLAPHKRPRAVYFVDRLPRNEMGKIRKTDLRT
jgi:malonyl-CoA/methylmalonyl-CoA synthetase